jgi:hypothetical protein
MVEGTTTMICGKCGKPLCRSRRKGATERLLLPRIGVFPFRCRMCSLRVYAQGRQKPAKLQGFRISVVNRLKAHRLLPEVMATAATHKPGELHCSPIPLQFVANLR